MAIDMEQYREKLTPKQIAQGISAAASNSKRLLHDAKLLFRSERFASATALAILSIEESGKIAILRELSLASEQDEIHALWRRFRKHTSKNLLWIVLDLVKSGARKLGDFKPVFDPDSDHPELLDKIKQICFYTDCLAKAHWSEPTEVINANLSESIIKAAEILEPKREVTDIEIEMWAKHIRPVWKRGAELMETAMIAFHEEMYSEGLTTEDPNKMKRFILGDYSEPSDNT